MIRKVLLILALLPSCAFARIRGDLSSIPVEPRAYTVLALPAHYQSDKASQDVLAAFGSNPELLALRDSTQVQTYSANDPDFKHRWAKQLPEVARDGKAALIVEDANHKLIYGRAGATADQLADDISSQNVLEKINGPNPSGSAGCIRCIRKVMHPQKDDDDEPVAKKEPEILRPLLPPPRLDPVQKEEVVKAAEIGVGLLTAMALAPVGLVMLGGLSYLGMRHIQENSDN